jgi:DNA-binding LacI/PurR family transcriptional regulator
LVLSILQGVEAECSQRGYNMLLSTPRLSDDGVDENYRQLIQSGYLDGIIAIDNIPVASALKPANQKGVPTVCLGYHTNRHYVRSDDFSGGVLLMEHILELGHRAIGIIGAAEELHFSIHHRLAGLRATADEAGLDFTTFPVANGDFSTTSGAAAAKYLLENYSDLTALICLNDRMAMGAIQQARTMGRKVPRDLTVVGYDDIPTAELFAPPLTTIDQQAPKLGQIAAAMLFEVLNGKHPDPVILPTRLVVRQSSSAVPG